MAGKQGCSVHRKPISQSQLTPDTLQSQMPELDRLFRHLDEGVTPTFLDIMKAISEMVAFYTNCDSNREVEQLLEEKMSEKNCRFCS